MKKFIIISGLTVCMLINISCKGGGGKGDTAEGSIDFDKLNRKYSHFKYAEIINELYFPVKKGEIDTALAPAYMTLSASRLSRLFHEMYLFEIELGQDLYNLVIKNKRLNKNVYHHYFGSIYFYLAGDNKQAQKVIDLFIKQKGITSKWRSDARKLKRFYQTQKFIKGKAAYEFNSSLFEALDAKYVQDSKDNTLFKGNNIHAWKLTGKLLNADFNNILSLYEKITSTNLSYQSLFKEKIGEIQITDDSTFVFYQNYYNPLLLKAFANFYKLLAEKFYAFYNNCPNPGRRLNLNVQYEMSALFQEWNEYDKAREILKQMKNEATDELLKGFIQIDSYYCKNKLESRKINFEKRLNSLESPILKSYFLYKFAAPGCKFDDKKIKKQFNFNDMNRSEQLTCSEFLGNYFYRLGQFSRAQDLYQKRLLGGTFDLEANRHYYLLNFAKSYYYNQLNRDQGLWILRKFLYTYPMIKQLEHKYSNILAEKIFK